MMAVFGYRGCIVIDSDSCFYSMVDPFCGCICLSVCLRHVFVITSQTSARFRMEFDLYNNGDVPIYLVCEVPTHFPS